MVGKLDIADLPSLPPNSRLELTPGVGVGLKHQYLSGLMANPTRVDFVEIHAENFMTPGAARELLLEASKQWPLSIHGVALSLGGNDPLDGAHLSRLKDLVDIAKPAIFSEHIAWCRHDGTYFNDLLPVPYNRQTLNRLCDRVYEVQQYLGRQILLENPSSYVRFQSDTMHEADFVAELVHRTGCGILLDLNNLYVSAQNHGWDTGDWLSRIQLDAVGEVHLAGHELSDDDIGHQVLIDTHGEEISGAVWFLYSEFLSAAGPRPTLIERDNNVPAIEDMLEEVALARFLMQSDMGKVE
ncbi:DUF692 domain-containing protein [Kordiimonas sp.]|uniref:MNIO family bufferin maturase n=1 Tax=Kordiimonas sp. TaxID=1970157 RepID=UPI003A9309C0